MTGFDTSIADPKDALKIGKFDSIQSQKKSSRRHVSLNNLQVYFLFL